MANHRKQYEEIYTFWLFISKSIPYLIFAFLFDALYAAVIYNIAHDAKKAANVNGEWLLIGAIFPLIGTFAALIYLGTCIDYYYYCKKTGSLKNRLPELPKDYYK